MNTTCKQCGQVNVSPRHYYVTTGLCRYVARTLRRLRGRAIHEAKLRGHRVKWDSPVYEGTRATQAGQCESCGALVLVDSVTYGARGAAVTLGCGEVRQAAETGGGVRGGGSVLHPEDSEVEDLTASTSSEPSGDSRILGPSTNPLVQRQELAMAIDAKLARYSASGSPELKGLDADDWHTIRTVLDYLRSNHRTGAFLPASKQLEVLTNLERFPALQIAFACASFLDGGCIEARRPLRYFLGVVRGSAAEKYAELVSSRHKTGRFNLEVQG